MLIKIDSMQHAVLVTLPIEAVGSAVFHSHWSSALSCCAKSDEGDSASAFETNTAGMIAGNTRPIGLLTRLIRSTQIRSFANGASVVE